MLHKKHTIRDLVAVGKKESKKLREAVTAAFQKEHSKCLESFWKTNDPVVRVTWEFSSGGSVALYLLNNIPLVLSTTLLPNDAQDILAKGQEITVPTLFFLLLMRNFYKDDDADVASLFGPRVWCRGPTSQFVISGAHLMMPGVLGLDTKDGRPAIAGEAVFIYSVGNTWPYAVGLATADLVRHSERGRGVYVLHSYKDFMWDTYFTAFSARCGNATSTLPITFQDSGVLEIGVQSPDTANGDAQQEGPPNDDGMVSEVPDDYTSKNGDDLLKRSLEMLEAEDGVVDFALCETIRNFSQSMLPMPLTGFLPLLLSNFPRVPSANMQVDFKTTKYKKALPYLLSRSDLVTICEGKKGIYSLVEINKSAELLRRHRRSYADFLQLIHDPAKEEENLRAEKQAIQECAKGAFRRRIISIETLLSPRGRSAMELKKILCTGAFPDLGSEKSPSGVQDTQHSSQNPKSDDDDDFLDVLYSRKHVCDNLRRYIVEKGLLHTGGENGGAPFVHLSGALSPLARGSDQRMRITEVDELVFQQLFLPVHQLVMEDSPIINGVVASKTLITRISRKGTLPKVVLYTEKRAGNKVVTVVKYLDTYGFELSCLTSQWKQQFSTYCSVYDPSKEMQKVKDGTKITLELHLGGDWVSQLKVVLEKELGIPHHLINATKKK